MLLVYHAGGATYTRKPTPGPFSNNGDYTTAFATSCENATNRPAATMLTDVSPVLEQLGEGAEVIKAGT